MPGAAAGGFVDTSAGRRHYGATRVLGGGPFGGGFSRSRRTSRIGVKRLVPRSPFAGRRLTGAPGVEGRNPVHRGADYTAQAV
jgi:hypothetical protein